MNTKESEKGGASAEVRTGSESWTLKGARRFSLGRVVITSHAREVLIREDVEVGLVRHHAADWGDVGAEDWRENERGLAEGSRLLSAYHDRNGRKFWIITEWDRSCTTILLPEDY